MLPGPTLIRKCSVCSNHIEQPTIVSGNTFGATFWTDGKREAPMLPDEPWLVMCPHCHAPLWIDELEELGEVEPFGETNSEFHNATEYEVPVLNDYFTALKQELTSFDKERYLRLRTWWAGNDARRTNIGRIPISSQEESNLIALLQILDESIDNDLVMKAEIMRELSRFEEAETLLAKPMDGMISQVATFIKNLASDKDPIVRKIEFNHTTS
jgi:hypothetical protein